MGCGSPDATDDPRGGQTGGEMPVPGASGGCEGMREEFTLDAPTPLAATARTVLEPVLGTHTAPLLWRSNTGPLTIGPEQGLSQVELTVTYSGGHISWLHFDHDEAAATPGAGATPQSCPVEHLEIELDGQLRTAGGALDERFPIRLAAVAVDNVQFTEWLQLDTLQGTFVATPTPGFRATALRVTTVWDVFGFRGTVLGEVELSRDSDAGSGDASSVGVGLVPIADWPPPAGDSGP